jgi:hypothetical protein
MADQDPNAPKFIPKSLPVFWKSGDKVVAKSETKIQLPTGSETATFSQQDAKTCGGCRHFRGAQKDRPTIKGFVAAALHEAGWKKMFLGDKPENLGRCSEDEGLVVGPNSRACTHYSQKR